MLAYNIRLSKGSLEVDVPVLFLYFSNNIYKDNYYNSYIKNIRYNIQTNLNSSGASSSPF